MQYLSALHGSSSVTHVSFADREFGLPHHAALHIEQRHGTKTPLNTEQIHIEPKASKGEMLLAVVLDDDVVSAYRSDE